MLQWMVRWSVEAREVSKAPSVYDALPQRFGARDRNGNADILVRDYESRIHNVFPAAGSVVLSSGNDIE